MILGLLLLHPSQAPQEQIVHEFLDRVPSEKISHLFLYIATLCNQFDRVQPASATSATCCQAGFLLRVQDGRSTPQRFGGEYDPVLLNCRFSVVSYVLRGSSAYETTVSCQTRWLAYTELAYIVPNRIRILASHLQLCDGDDHIDRSGAYLLHQGLPSPAQELLTSSSHSSNVQDSDVADAFTLFCRWQLRGRLFVSFRIWWRWNYKRNLSHLL